MELSELLSALGQHIGLDLTLDEAGSCALSIDEMNVMIQDVSEAYAVGFWGKIGAPPPQWQKQLYEMMLDANHLFRATAGATISRDPESGDFYLCRLLDVRCLDVENFISALEKFVNTLEAWQKVLADYRPVAEALETSSAESGGASEPPQSMMGAGFIQI